MGWVKKKLSEYGEFAGGVGIAGSAYIPALEPTMAGMGAWGLVISGGILGAGHLTKRSVAKELRDNLDRLSLTSQENEKLVAEIDETIRKSELIKSDAFTALHMVLSNYIKSKALAHFNGKVPNGLRTTVYTHNQNENNLSQLARYAANPEYNGSGRSSYRLDGGAIGNAWRYGSSEARILADPNSSLEDYEKELVDVWSMFPADVAQLSMKSRHLLSKKIRGGSDGTTDIGVVLIETDGVNLTQREKNFLTLVAEDADKIINNIMFYEYGMHKSHTRSIETKT